MREKIKIMNNKNK